MKVSDLLVKCLETEGVKYVFALPGEEVEDLLFSLQKSSIKLITTRHEQGAAFMADVWGRLTGDAGVCLATLGPGATNLLTGLADAHMDKSPVVAITGQGDLKRHHKESHQYIDVVNMFRPVVKWNISVHDKEIIPEVVRKAFKVSQWEKPGVTHIELPEDIAEQRTGGEPIVPRVVRRPSPDYKAVNSAIELLKNAKKPIILAGNGAIRKLASKHLRMFVEKTGIPVVSTFMGKGAVSDKDSHCLHSIGMQSKDYQVYAFEEADLIISVGFDIAELYPITLRMMNPKKDKKIIHIDFAQAEIDQYYDPHVELVADISASIWALNEKLKANEIKYDKEWYKKYRDAIQQDHNRYELTNDEFTIPGVLLTMRKYLKDEDIVISDVGSHKVWVGRMFPVYEPGTCIISNGFASMGIAVPGGIAAKLAQPEKHVVAVSGDGGFLMNSQELETAKRLGLKGYTILIVNDNNYGLITWKQNMHVNKSYGTNIDNPDFKAFAESFGIKAYHPKTVRDLNETFESTIKNNELSLIVVDVNPEVNTELSEKLKQDLSINF